MKKRDSKETLGFWWESHSYPFTPTAGTFLSLPYLVGQTFLSVHSNSRDIPVPSLFVGTDIPLPPADSDSFGGQECPHSAVLGRHECPPHQFKAVPAASAIVGLLALALCLSLCGCTATTTIPTTAQPLAAADEEPSTADAWKIIAQTLGKPGELKDGVYSVTFPRDDLTVRIEGMDVPTGAGLESVFHFYQCSCGKTVVIGQFVCTDYEANDVAYALQKENLIISAIGPYLMYEKPRLMSVRFQAEGKPQPLAAAIHSALMWTGKNRIPPPEKLTP